jgi:predicted transcriptional regulator
MSVGVLTCSLDTPLVQLTQALLDKDQEAAVVLDETGNAVGVVTRAELVRSYARGDYETLTAESVMREDVPQAPPDVPLPVAAQIMQDQGVRVLYMMHHAGGIEYPAAFLSYTHFLRHLATGDDADLSDLGIRAERQTPMEAFLRRREEARRRAGLT